MPRRLRLVDAEEAGVAHLLEEFVRREDLGVLPGVDVGVDLGLDELLHRALQFLVFMGIKHKFS
jgi:hypothetical protein